MVGSDIHGHVTEVTYATGSVLCMGIPTSAQCSAHLAQLNRELSVSVRRYPFFKYTLECDPCRYHVAFGNIKISFVCDITLCSLEMPSPDMLVTMYPNTWCLAQMTVVLTFRHRVSCILGQAFHYSPENAFYIFNQQITLSDIFLTVHH